jgi:two-component system, OmpR family, sensor kinase
VTRARRLRRLRIVLTAVATALVALMAALYARHGLHAGRDRLNQEVADTAQRNMADIFHQFSIDQQRPPDSLSWYVDLGKEPGQRYNEAFDEQSGLEPPVFAATQQAVDSEYGESWTEFNSGGSQFLAYTRTLGDQRAFYTLVDRSYWDGRYDAMVNRWRWTSLGVVALSALIMWWLIGRALSPAREAMTDQQGFLADAAHELRTPLAVILASASQTLSRPREQAEYVASLSEIRTAAERSAAGVTNMLDAARFEAGQMIPRTAPVRLDLLAEEVAASVRLDDVEIVAEPGAAVIVDADMALIRQALDNVVRNAAGRAGKVRLVTSSEGRDGLLSVIDDGPGFDAAILDHVFDRYRRGDGRGNAGLGLAIARSIALAHGGEVSAANEAVGGAKVTLRLPLSRKV